MTVRLKDFQAQTSAEVVRLEGASWYSRNTLGNPDEVVPEVAEVDVPAGNKLTLHLRPYSLTLVTLKPAG